MTVNLSNDNTRLYCITHGPCQKVMRTNSEEVLRIFGAIKGDNWRLRKNYKFNTLIEDKNTVSFVKAQRISWLGHV